MRKELHFWTVKHWMNQPGQNYNAFSIWASPSFVAAARKAMEKMDPEKAQDLARDAIKESGDKDVFSIHHHWLQFRPEVGLAHINVPGNACGLDLDFKDEETYLRNGFTLLPHNIDTAHQQSTIFLVWLRWAQYVELYAEEHDPAATD